MKSTILFLILAFAPWIASVEASAPATAENAVLHLQKFWRDSLVLKLKDSLHLPLLRYLMFEPNRVGARRTSSTEAWNRVSNSLTSEQKLILIGKLDDLKRDKPVWAVTNPGGGPGFEAYLDSATGELLFLWIILEG